MAGVCYDVDLFYNFLSDDLNLSFTNFCLLQEEDEEEIEGVFFNELWILDLDKGKWFPGQFR